MKIQVQIPQNTTLSLKTDLKGNIMSVNDDFVKLIGFDRHELLGHSIQKVIHPQTPKSVGKKISKILNFNEPWNGILKNQTKSGDFFWANTTVTPYYDSEGNTIGYMYVERSASDNQIKKGEEFYQNPNQQETRVRFYIESKKISI